jgi:Dolichyl-phosphate-mannose-protein mannosyltransferase
MAASAASTTDFAAASPVAREASWAPWLILIVALAANVAIRWPLLGMPLERDEGEFGYGGQLLLEGEPPYRSLYAMKWPGIYAAYAVVEVVFGQTTEGIHQGLILATSINIVWMFFIGRRLVDACGGAWAAAAFAALCLSPGVEPTSTQSQHFVLLFALPGIYLLIVAWQAPRVGLWLLAGLCFGAGALMKQHGAFLALTGFAPLAWELVRGQGQRRAWLAASMSYVAGLCLPLAVTCALLQWSGTFDAFWLWTVEYAQAYATGNSLAVGIQQLVAAVRKQVPPIWPLIAVAVWGVVVEVRRRRISSTNAVLAMWTIASLVAVVPGWHFRPHYFFLLWPSLAMWAALGLRSLTIMPPANEPSPQHFSWEKVGGWIAALAIVGWPVANSAQFLLTQSHWQLSRAMYGIDPFNECPPVADYLRAHTTRDDTIAVLGSQPQLYFLSQRRSATGHMYVYPLLERHAYARQMQDGMIREVEQSRPKYVVLVQDWVYHPGAPTTILEWLSDYIDKHFELVGCVEIISPHETRFAWEEAARSYQPSKYCIVQVYRRRET